MSKFGTWFLENIIKPGHAETMDYGLTGATHREENGKHWMGPVEVPPDIWNEMKTLPAICHPSRVPLNLV